MFVVAVGIVFIVCAFLEIDGVNGVAYWHWPWRRLKPLHTALWLLPPMSLFAVAQYLIARAPKYLDIAAPLLLLTCTCFGLQMCAALSHAPGLAYIRAIVESPMATSYYNEALKISDVRDWLATFDSTSLLGHAATHPPGPILYYAAWLWLVGADHAALAAGIALGLIAALSIPLLYVFSGFWTSDRRVRLVACGYFSLIPAFIVLLPEFDQAYPVFTLLMAIAWMKSLRSVPTHAFFAGLVFAVAAFFAYNLLVLGTFALLFGCHHVLTAGDRVPALRKAFLATLSALAGFAVFYLSLWLVSDYDAPKSFAHALAMQQFYASGYDRPWRITVFYDIYDFMLGAGILAAPLLFLFLRRAYADFAWNNKELMVLLIGLATIAVVDVSGLLYSETARVWLFLQPFAIAPAATELARFGPRGRTLFFALQWLVDVTIFCKMSFVAP